MGGSLQQLSPLERRASVPLSRQAACQAYADFRDTRNTRATCSGRNPAANISAAWNRTRSRRARSTAVRPPPSGYLMPPDYTHPPQPRHPEAKTSVVVLYIALEPDCFPGVSPEAYAAFVAHLGPVVDQGIEPDDWR